MATARESGAATIKRAFPNSQTLWTTTIDRGAYPAHWVEAIAVGRVVVIVHEYGAGNGWQAYVPATRNNRIDATLLAIGDAAGGIEPHLNISDREG